MIEKNRKNYLKSEVQKESINYFNGDALAADVWMNKYCLKDDINGETHYYELSPHDMHLRIATELNRIEKKYPNPRSVEDIFSRLDKFKRIIPGGSPMSGIGNDFQVVSLSNCFVIGNDKDSDSYGGIMKIDQEIVQLQKRRGGVGTDLSFIRPAGSPVKNSAITSTGVVPFMTRFSNTTKEVAQDGRRGALMLSCFTPDTFVLVDYGWDNIKNVINKIKNGVEVKAWTHDGLKKITDTQEFKDRDVYEIEAENGKKIKVTPDHEFMVRNINTDEEYLKAIIDVDVENEELIFYLEN